MQNCNSRFCLPCAAAAAAAAGPPKLPAAWCRCGRVACVLWRGRGWCLRCLSAALVRRKSVDQAAAGGAQCSSGFELRGMTLWRKAN